MTDLLFFSVANEAYEPFVLPYAASCLTNNPGARLELVLERPKTFEHSNADALDILATHTNGRFTLSRSSFGRTPANSLRFLIEPKSKADTVYIGDIDIIITEDIRQGHEDHMARTGLLYSNIARPGKRALTGLHYTRWDAYYPVQAVPPHSKVNLDEALLYDLVEARGLDLPDADDNYRPIHGIHLSLNRDPRDLKGSWGGINSFPEVARYVSLTQTDLWMELAPYFDVRYRRLIALLETAIVLTHKDRMADFAPTTGTLSKDWW